MKKLLLSFVCIFPFIHAASLSPEELAAIKQLTTAPVPTTLAEAEKNCSCTDYQKALKEFLAQPGAQINLKDSNGLNTLGRIFPCDDTEMIRIARKYGAIIQVSPENQARYANAIERAKRKRDSDIDLLQTLDTVFYASEYNENHTANAALSPEELKKIKLLTTAMPPALAQAEKNCSCTEYQKALKEFLAQPNTHINQKNADGFNTLERLVAHCDNTEMLLVARKHGATLVDYKGASLLTQAIHRAIKKRDMRLLQTLNTLANKEWGAVVSKGRLVLHRDQYEIYEHYTQAEFDQALIFLYEQGDYVTIDRLMPYQAYEKNGALLDHILSNGNLKKIQQFKEALSTDGSYNKSFAFKMHINAYCRDREAAAKSRYLQFLKETTGISTPDIQKMANELKQEYERISAIRETLKFSDSDIFE